MDGVGCVSCWGPTCEASRAIIGGPAKKGCRNHAESAALVEAIAYIQPENLKRFPDASQTFNANASLGSMAWPTFSDLTCCLAVSARASPLSLTAASAAERSYC